MRIFLTGGAGYIGSVCTEQLLNEGHEVAIFDNLSEGHRRAIDPRARFIEGDLAHREQIETALSSCRSDAVMHFAANALVGESMQNPSKYFRNNISNGLNLLDAMDATAPARPISPYGESKLAFEKILRWYDQIHGLKFVCLRYFNAAGATENFGED